MKKILIIVAVFILSSFSLAEIKFLDINSNDWFYENIYFLANKNIVNGYENGCFMPNNNITRAEFIKMYVGLSDNIEKNIDLIKFREKFNIPTGKWYDAYIDKAIKKELILFDEVDVNLSELEKPITRNEMAILISRSLKNEIINIDFKFSDTQNYNILKVYNCGIINGYLDSTFRGNNNSTRAEAVTVLSRYIDKNKRIKLTKKENIFSIVGENGVNISKTKLKNYNFEDIEFERWAAVPDKYVYGENGFINILYFDENIDKLVFKTYDKYFHLINDKKIDFELSIFGGLYNAKDYNYIVFGDVNEIVGNRYDENDIVVKIVKYDKNYNKISELNLSEANSELYTTIPFSAGSIDFLENKNELIIHTARLRYDGHQSQLTMIIDTENMTLKENIGQYQANHVSHSFNQFVRKTENDVFYLDHGDAFPRTVVLTVKDKTYKNYITNTSYQLLPVRVDMVQIPWGYSGANQTGVFVGGFEVTKNNLIVAYDSLDMNKKYEMDDFNIYGDGINHRNIYLSVLPKENINQKYVKNVPILDNNPNLSRMIKSMIKINDNKFACFYLEFESEKMNNKKLKMIFIDENGNKLSDAIVLDDFYLNLITPKIINNEIVWFDSTNEGKIVFYNIKLND